MAQTVSILLNAADKVQLQQIVNDRNRPLKHVLRAKIILFSGERLSVLDVARHAGVSRPAVWRWQKRFAEEGVDGLLRDKTRKPGTPPIAKAVVDRIVALDLHGAAWRNNPLDGPSDGQGGWRFVDVCPTHLDRPSSSAASHPHVQALQRSEIRREGRGHRRPLHGPARPRGRRFDRRESQIQALDRTQPGLPLKPGKCGTMTHDYKRNGTTTLFAAFDVLNGTVVGRCMPKHRHQEFIKFLGAVERAVPAGKVIHAVLDNYATHKHPKVLQWLADHPRWTFHFTPTSGSWLNAVENFFSVITRRAIRRGVFKSVADLQDAIRAYIKRHNADPVSFVWTKPADTILAKLRRLPEPSD